MNNTRELSLEILLKTLNDSSYANLLMRKELNAVEPINRPFVSEMVYGVLRHYLLLEYQVRNEIDSKTKLRLRLILCMALYERYFLSTKEYALVNEYVELAKNPYDKSFINAILRKERKLEYPAGNSAEDLSVIYSLPVWICALLIKQYDEKTRIRMFETFGFKAITYYRINHHKCNFIDLAHLPIQKVNDDFFISKKPLISSKEFSKGFFYIQDINSAEITKALCLNEDCTFLDMCSAPGSKLFNCLEIIKEENAYANDLHVSRVELIKKKAGILGYSKVHYYNLDGRILREHLNMQFDRILLDAPCSGLGVLSRRPDIRYHIEPSSLDELEILQKELLESAFLLLKEGGILVYSTCTVNRKENDRQVDRFIKQHKELKLIKEKTVLEKGGDLFYYACIEKGIINI